MADKVKTAQIIISKKNNKVDIELKNGHMFSYKDLDKLTARLVKAVHASRREEAKKTSAKNDSDNL